MFSNRSCIDERRSIDVASTKQWTEDNSSQLPQLINSSFDKEITSQKNTINLCCWCLDWMNENFPLFGFVSLVFQLSVAASTGYYLCTLYDDWICTNFRWVFAFFFFFSSILISQSRQEGRNAGKNFFISSLCQFFFPQIAQLFGKTLLRKRKGRTTFDG